MEKQKRVRKPRMEDLIPDPKRRTEVLSRLYKECNDKTTSKKIIAIYIKKFFQRPFSNKEIKKLLAYINELPQDLKEQFLSAALFVPAASFPRFRVLS